MDGGGSERLEAEEGRETLICRHAAIDVALGSRRLTKPTDVPIRSIYPDIAIYSVQPSSRSIKRWSSVPASRLITRTEHDFCSCQVGRLPQNGEPIEALSWWVRVRPKPRSLVVFQPESP